MNRRNVLKAGVATAATIGSAAVIAAPERVEYFEGQAFLEGEANRLKAKHNDLAAKYRDALDDQIREKVINSFKINNEGMPEFIG